MTTNKIKGVVNPSFVDDTNNLPNELDAKKLNDEEAGEARPTWGNKTEFLMSCISMSVGLGNIWRFPFTAYENGGGAFLIPYLIVLFLIGKPLYYMEMALGQFTSRSSVHIWHSVPLLKGIGIGQMLGTISVVTYYVSLIALTLVYLISSFSSELPWATCRDSWDEQCVDSSEGHPVIISNGTGYSMSSSELYFTKEVINEKLNISDGIGLPDWKLSLWLLLAWICIFLVIVRGVKSSGKISYFLAIFPYLVLVTILIRACTLDGALDGIIYFIKPQWGELLNPKVWYNACTQLFFSMGVGMGSIIMYSSFNKFEHNIYRDVMIVTSLDAFTSLLGGFTVFGILGSLAFNLGVPIDKVICSGSGLAFISYPDAIAKFSFVPQLFAVLFFFMMFTLGMGSVVGLHSAIVTSLLDEFPKFKYWQMALLCSIIGFFTGLVYITPGGQWMLTLVDQFCGTFIIFALAIIEIMGIMWIYGLENICNDIEFMSGRKVTLYWRLCWGLVTPVFMSVIFIYAMAEYKPPTYSELDFPDGYIVAGWVLFAIGVLQLPLWAMWIFSRQHEKSFKKNIQKSLTPHHSWGPKSSKTRKDWISFKANADELREKTIREENHSWIQQKCYILLGRYLNL